MKDSILNLIEKYQQDMKKMEDKFQKNVNFMTTAEHFVESQTHNTMMIFYKKVIEDLKNLKE